MPFSDKGWLKGGTRKPSPNLYVGGNSREIIVMHYTAGYTASGAINTFVSPASKASAHFVVDHDGTITQMVNTVDRAWHAGGAEYQGRPRVNDFSIGIEIVNPGYHYRTEAGAYLNWQRKPVPAASLAPFGDMTKASDPWVGSAPVWWPGYPEAQLDALETLCLDLLESYPTLRDVVGHRDVDVVRRLKVDPGPAFPLRRFRLLLDRRDEDPASRRMTVATAGGNLNVRGGPGTGFDLMSWGPLRNGETVSAGAAHGDWTPITVERGGVAGEGWVFSRYLKPA